MIYKLPPQCQNIIIRVILKHICDNGKNYQLILRLKTSQDPIGYKNSVITFLKVDDKRYNRYLHTKKILYKNE